MRIALVLVALLFLLPMTHAEIGSVDISADIAADSSVRHTLLYNFLQPLPVAPVNYTLSQGVRDISVTGDGDEINYEVSGGGIRILPQKPVNILSISYTADNVVFRSGEIYHFFTEFNFDESVRELNMTISLPKGYIIHDNFYRPESGKIETDGAAIFIHWSEAGVLGSRMFSVNFTNPSEHGDIFLFLLIVLVIAVMLGFMHYRKKLRESFMRGFREDEKKVIEFLQLRKVVLQSDLQKQFGFSRAKATRIVMHLEQKNLVRKERYGRTNRLYWKKR